MKWKRVFSVLTGRSATVEPEEDYSEDSFEASSWEDSIVEKSVYDEPEDVGKAADGVADIHVAKTPQVQHKAKLLTDEFVSGQELVFPNTKTMDGVLSFYNNICDLYSYVEEDYNYIVEGADGSVQCPDVMKAVILAACHGCRCSLKESEHVLHEACCSRAEIEALGSGDALLLRSCNVGAAAIYTQTRPRIAHILCSSIVGTERGRLLLRLLDADRCEQVELARQSESVVWWRTYCRAALACDYTVYVPAAVFEAVHSVCECKKGESQALLARKYDRGVSMREVVDSDAREAAFAGQCLSLTSKALVIGSHQFSLGTDGGRPFRRGVCVRSIFRHNGLLYVALISARTSLLLYRIDIRDDAVSWNLVTTVAIPSATAVFGASGAQITILTASTTRLTIVTLGDTVTVDQGPRLTGKLVGVVAHGTRVSAVLEDRLVPLRGTVFNSELPPRVQSVVACDDGAVAWGKDSHGYIYY